MQKDVLVVGAFNGEIDTIKKHIDFHHILECGIGNTVAGINLACHLSNHPDIRHIIFTGSAGYYPHNSNKYQIGDIVYANHFLSCEISDLIGITKAPASMPVALETKTWNDLSHFLQNKQLKSGVVNATNRITSTDLSNDLLEKTSLREASFENMESFGLAQVAIRFGTSFTGLYALTNQVGENGSREWNENWRQCSHELQTLLLDFLA